LSTLRGFATAVGCSLAIVAALSGCGPKETRQRCVIGTAAEFRPDVPAASKYNEHVESAAPEGELEQLILDVVAQVAIQQGADSPQPDPRLALVARDLASQIVGDDPPGYDLIEFAGGILRLAGWKTRPVASILAVYVVTAAAVAHRYWTYAPAQAFAQTSFFYKNLAITGGLLYVAVMGAGKYSVDKR
jgi:uncharacterized membrane protein YphA (DoxX/SURF4 family)